MRKLFLLLLLLSYLQKAQAQPQANLYVDSSVAASGAGTSWATAYKTVNEALNLANNGSTTVSYNVHIAKGTYYPTGAQNGTDRNLTFGLLRNGLRVYGGYPTGGGVRDAATHLTLLSGDVGVAGSMADNSYHVITMNGIPQAGDSTTLDGVTVAYGNANGGFSGLGGGGLYINGTSTKAEVRYCIIRDNKSGYQGGGVFMSSIVNLKECQYRNNRAQFGGAIYTSGYNQPYRNSVFEDNIADTTGGAIYSSYALDLADCSFSRNRSLGVGGGGAIYMSNGFLAVRCVFSQNTAAASGGALYIRGSGKIDSCTFSANKAGGSSYYGEGGAIMRYGTGGWIGLNGSLRCSNVTFNDNAALQGSGGAVYENDGYYDTSSYRNCTFTQDSALYGGALFGNVGFTVSTSIFKSNYASNSGGAVYSNGSLLNFDRDSLVGNRADTTGGAFFLNYYGCGSTSSSSCTSYLTNLLISGNKGGKRGGAFAMANVGSSNIRITNCTLAGDSAVLGNGIYCTNSSSPTVKNCIIWEGATNSLYTVSGSFPMVTYSLVEGGFMGAGNTSTNPAFVASQPASAAPTTAGNYALTACSPAINATNSISSGVDVAGNPRQVGITVDMGAYEYNASLVSGTISGPATVCVGASDSFMSSASGGTWSSSTPAIATVDMAGVVTGISTGTDTLRYTVSSNCPILIEKVIAIVSLPAPTLNVNSGAPVCQGVNFTVSNSSSGTWAIGDTNIIGIRSLSGTVAQLTAKTAGMTTISATVTSSTTGCTGTTTQTITVNSVPTVANITGDDTVCTGATLQLSNTTPGGTWGKIQAGGNVTIGSTGLVTGTTAGNVYVTYTVTNTAGCTATDSQFVHINPSAVVPPISGPSVICIGKPVPYTNATTGGTWSVSGTQGSITSAGVYTATTTGYNVIRYAINDAVTGCPGTGTITVRGLGPVSKTVNATFCGIGNYNFGGQIITAAGTYKDTFQTYYGCDSVATLNYSNVGPDTSIVQSGGTLTAVATGVFYSWFECVGSSKNPVGNATRNFTPTHSGQYGVSVTNSFCTAESGCYPVMVSAVSNISTRDWNLYPNPTTGSATLQTGSVIAKTVLVRDITGKRLLEVKPTGAETVLDVKGFAPGVYLVTVADDEGNTATLRLTVAR